MCLCSAEKIQLNAVMCDSIIVRKNGLHVVFGGDTRALLNAHTKIRCVLLAPKRLEQRELHADLEEPIEVQHIAQFKKSTTM